MGKRKTHKTAEVDLSFLFAGFFETFLDDKEFGFSVEEPMPDTQNFEEYLQKGEKLFSLAREKFKREFKEMNLCDADEKVFSTLPLETDTLYDIVCRVAKCYTRPLLCSMRSTDDEYCKQLMESVTAPGLRIEVLIVEDDKYVKSLRRQYKEQSKAETACLRVTLYEDGYSPLVVYGMKDFAHTQRYKCGIFVGGAGICVADMGDFFSYLIVYKYLADVLVNVCAGKADECNNVVRQFNERLRYFEKDFVAKCVQLYPKKYEPLLEEFTLEDIFALPVHVYRVENRYGEKSFLDVLKAFDVAFTNHERHSELQSFLNSIPDTESPSAYIASGGKDLAFCVANRVRLPYHALLDTDYSGSGYWYPVPAGKKSKKRYYREPEKFHLLADLFRIVAEEKCSQRQMSSYYRELEQSYAKSYMLKKEITNKVQKAMKSSLFNRYFGFVEFDVETDLAKVEEIAKEFVAVKEKYLNNVDSSRNAIRFRKLGQHKALGLYYPSVACLCVDIHSPSSLIHEYGHLIDYTYGGLSRQYEFAHIKKLYASWLDDAMDRDQGLKKRMNGNGKYNKAYYLMPTEIFARCFELYISKCLGVNNSIVPSEFSNGFAYPLSEDFLSEVRKYFDSLDLCDNVTDVTIVCNELQTA